MPLLYKKSFTNIFAIILLHIFQRVSKANDSCELVEVLDFGLLKAEIVVFSALHPICFFQAKYYREDKLFLANSSNLYSNCSIVSIVYFTIWKLNFWGNLSLRLSAINLEMEIQGRVTINASQKSKTLQEWTQRFLEQFFQRFF